MSPNRQRPHGGNREGVEALPGRKAKRSVVPAPVLEAFNKGWTVIPQEPETRKPEIRWGKHTERRPTILEIERLAALHPNALWAILTGRSSGIVVLDFDGERGVATATALGFTPNVLTPSGGWHVWIEQPSFDVRSGSKVSPIDFPGLDIKAHVQLATFYGERPGKSRPYEVVSWDVVSLADVPAKVMWLLRQRERRERAPVAAPLPDGFDDYADDDELLTEALRVAERGGRNEGGFHLACQARDERRDKAQIWALMKLFVDRVGDRGTHPYTLQEAYDSVEQALSEPPRQPRAVARHRATNDVGNAERLVDLHGDDIRYCAQTGRWYEWVDGRWRIDDDGAMTRRAIETAKSIVAEAESITDDKARLAHARFSSASQSRQRLEGMVAVARAQSSVLVRVEQLDANPMLLNVRNGVLDLRTGELRPHSRDLLQTRMAAVEFDPGAQCPVFDRYLREVMPNDETRAFLQRAAGYSLTGLTTEQCLFILHGGGQNGKSVFVRALRKMLGDYSLRASTDLLLMRQTGAASNDVARLQGARLVATSEADKDRRLAEALIKELTGDDGTAARFLYGEYFEFDMQGKIWLSTNELPKIAGSDDGIWRRIRLIPFEVKIEEGARDGDLKNKLALEFPGILNWAHQGLAAFLKNGLGYPPAVRGATERYRQEQDVFGQFIDACCVLRPGAFVEVAELGEAFGVWSAEQGYRFPWSLQKIGTELTNRGFQKDKHGKAKRIIYFGIELRSASEGAGQVKFHVR